MGIQGLVEFVFLMKSSGGFSFFSGKNGFLIYLFWIGRDAKVEVRCISSLSVNMSPAIRLIYFVIQRCFEASINSHFLMYFCKNKNE